MLVLLFVACGVSASAPAAGSSTEPEAPIAIVGLGTVSCSDPPLLYENATDVEVYAGGVMAFATEHGDAAIVAGSCVVEGR